MSTKYIATTCEFMLHEDDWNEGEGKLVSKWDEADCLKPAATIEGVLKQINYLKCDYAETVKKYPLIERRHDDFNGVFLNDPCLSNEHGRFDADLIVDVKLDKLGSSRIIKPTEAKYKQFERGEVKLYALHITVYVKKLTDLDENDIESVSR